MRLIAERLGLERGGRRLFQDLGFTLAGGEALLVTGPNGAGKSSLLLLIAGLLRPTEGRIELGGQGAERAPATVMHFVGHLDGVKAALTASENLEFMRALLGGRPDGTSALAALGIERLADLPAAMFSAGQKRRLALARLLIAPRPLWLLDEPVTSLDADGQSVFASLARAHLQRGGLIVAATHAPLGVDGARELKLGGGA
ncbi:MAG TPA: heme ABC exporter ATP-binding protein CcmA [Xanthobacteraceae bacterium]|nr:heme ABC exporter ATP-binding protein CcmA [Xanthobacteraceae bacterium]